MRPRARLFTVSLALLAGVALMGFGAPGSEAAPDDPSVAADGDDLQVEAIVDHRKGIMRAASGHMSASAGVLMDGVGSEALLPLHGQALAALLADIPDFFPEGSLHEESEALPVIWDNHGEFTDRAATTASRARAFADAVEEGNRQAMVQAFAALGDSCGACHETFRQ